MKKFSIEEMTKGWFVGNFEPTVVKTTDCEVGLKQYKAGFKEPSHYHRKAIELTVVVEGRISMNNEEFSKGDIVMIDKNEIVEFKAIEDAITVVYKSGSFKGDKYLAKSNE